MKAATRLTSKGQLVIPRSIRDGLKWRQGLRLVVETTPTGDVLLRPDRTKKRSIDEILDFLADTFKDVKGDPLARLEADHRAEIEQDKRWMEKFDRATRKRR